ncbi:MAG: hypothetical protein EOO14_00895 [Chitinophagaceae bacterium]|nr:MAG: hypothetical protein EOO14_00895 [Chitinophagaceae bacterium]
MGSPFKMFFASILINLGFMGIGLSIDLLSMDNASKEYFQVLYFVLLLVLSVVGNIALFTRSANAHQQGRHQFDFSVSLLSIVTGLFYIIALEGAAILPFIVFLVVGFLGIVKTLFIVQKARV